MQRWWPWALILPFIEKLKTKWDGQLKGFIHYLAEFWAVFLFILPNPRRLRPISWVQKFVSLSVFFTMQRCFKDQGIGYQRLSGNQRQHIHLKNSSKMIIRMNFILLLIDMQKQTKAKASLQASCVCQSQGNAILRILEVKNEIGDYICPQITPKVFCTWSIPLCPPVAPTLWLCMQTWVQGGGWQPLVHKPWWSLCSPVNRKTLYLLSRLLSWFWNIGSILSVHYSDWNNTTLEMNATCRIFFSLIKFHIKKCK